MSHYYVDHDLCQARGFNGDLDWLVINYLCDNQVWKPLVSHYYVDDDLCQARSIDGDFDWLVMNYLYELIDNDKD